MSHLKAVHWAAPTTMIISFLVGTLLALGHHLFYTSLNGELVAAGTYKFVGKTLQRQQFNTSVGTAFAFLTRTFLALAISTAYVQVFWRCIKEAKRSPTLGELDWAGDGLDNPLALFNLKVWIKYPLLILLAIMFWCIPIATILPSATISVKGSLVNQPRMLSVPQLDFTSFNYAADLQYLGSNTWTWNGPSQPVQNIALAVMGTGQILAIEPPTPNATWTQDFWGPAIECNNVDDVQRNNIWLNIWHSYNHSNSGPYVFLSWVPWSVDDGEEYDYNFTISGLDPDLPFLFDVSNMIDFRQSVGPAPSTISTGGPASLFLSTLPGMIDMLFSDLKNGTTRMGYLGRDVEYCAYSVVESLDDPMTDCDPGNTTFTPALAFNNATLLRCDLVNTSYSVNFDYSSGIQDIQILRNMTGESPIVNASAYFIGSFPSGASNVTGMVNCSSFQVQSFGGDDSNNCVFDPEAVRLSSYQGIMTAFNQILLGAMQNELSLLSVNGTTIMKTILGETEELAFIRNWNAPSDFVGPQELQPMLTSSSGWAYPGLTDQNPFVAHGDLKSTLEQVFQNLTISLLADSYFRPNYSSAFAPPELTNVTVETYENVYDYDRVTLCISYAVSIFFALIAVLIGLTSIILTGAAYSNNFSTIARISRAAELDVEIMPVHGMGYDPIPHYLKEARFTMGTHEGAIDASDRLSALIGRGSLIGAQRHTSDNLKGGTLQHVDEIAEVSNKIAVSGSDPFQFSTDLDLYERWTSNTSPHS